MRTSRQKGAHWEQVAESFLNRRGLKTLERNFHARFGEIDLVMLDGGTMVFAEVRYRENDSHGSGADSVTWTKQRRIISAARRFLQCHHADNLRPCRFDVISIGNRDGKTHLNWIKNAFDVS